MGTNIRTLMHENKPQDQAIAIALDVQRRAKGLKPARRRRKGKES